MGNFVFGICGPHGDTTVSWIVTSRSSESAPSKLTALQRRSYVIFTDKCSRLCIPLVSSEKNVAWRVSTLLCTQEASLLSSSEQFMTVEETRHNYTRPREIIKAEGM